MHLATKSSLIGVDMSVFQWVSLKLMSTIIQVWSLEINPNYSSQHFSNARRRQQPAVKPSEDYIK